MNISQIYKPVINNPISLTFFATKVSAGFPSPCDDYVEKKLDLTEHLVKHPEATFYVKACGDSMIGIGINEGDLLVVDKSLQAKNKSIVIAAINGEFTVKRLIKNKDKIILQPENDKYSSITVTEEMEFSVWGVVTNVIRKLT